MSLTVSFEKGLGPCVPVVLYPGTDSRITHTIKGTIWAVAAVANSGIILIIAICKLCIVEGMHVVTDFAGQWRRAFTIFDGVYRMAL